MTLTDAYIVNKASKGRVENEYYPTPAIATRSLVRTIDLPKKLWEPAAGRGHISQELIRLGHEVTSSDLFSYPDEYVQVDRDVDFLTSPRRDVDGVITNPPFKSNLPEKLIRRMLVDHDYKFLALFVRLTFLESARRYRLFKDLPPSKVLALSERVNCSEKYFDENDGIGGMVAYGWFVWDYRNGKPDRTELDWILPSDHRSRD